MMLFRPERHRIPTGKTPEEVSDSLLSKQAVQASKQYKQYRAEKDGGQEIEPTPLPLQPSSQKNGNGGGFDE